MRKVKCHVCKKPQTFIILLGEHDVCPLCFRDLYFGEKELPRPIINQLKSVITLSKHDTLDFMTAKIMCWFLKHGYSVSQCSRQLGITRATVYDKLRKYDLLMLGEDGKLTVNPMTADLLSSGHCKFVTVDKNVPEKTHKIKATTPALSFDKDMEYLKC